MRLLTCLLTLAVTAAQPSAPTPLRFAHAWDGNRLLDVLVTVEDDKIVSVEADRRRDYRSEVGEEGRSGRRLEVKRRPRSV